MSHTALKTFIIYARNDKTHKDELLSHLKPLTSAKMLEIWHDGDINPGEEWEISIKKNLKASEIILILVTKHCLNSNFIQTNELETALLQMKQGTARIIPIIVSPCVWELVPIFHELQNLPQDAKPITTWKDKDEAWTDVAKGIIATVKQIHVEKAEIEQKKQAEIERKEQERLQEERSRRLTQEQAEKERLEKIVEKAEQERLEKLSSEQKERERLEKIAEEKLAAEKAEKERLEKLAAEKAEKERLNKLAAEQKEKERLSKIAAERIADNLAEQERLEKSVAELKERERLAQELEEKTLQEEKEEHTQKFGEHSRVRQTLNETAPSFWGKYKIPLGIGLFVLLLGFYFVPKWLNKESKPIIDKATIAKRKQDSSMAAEKAAATIKVETKPTTNDFVPMIQVQGGTFKMGSDRQDNEKPIHGVTLSTYYIGTTEVTQGQWKNIMNTTPSYFKDCENCPVENVSWDDIQQFLKKLNQKYPSKNYRLPTEAEWEFAAKGGNKSKGYTYSGSNSIKDIAWIDENSDQKTHPVGQKDANELGLFDMSGNVWEWCSDWYGNYSGSLQTNPKGVSSGSDRVFRGRSWFCDAAECRVTYRGTGSPSSRSHGVGFRLARTY